MRSVPAGRASGCLNRAAGTPTRPRSRRRPTEVSKFTGYRTSFYDPPNEPAATAKLRARQAHSPLTFVTGASADPATYVPKAAAKVTSVKPKKAVRAWRCLR